MSHARRRLFFALKTVIALVLLIAAGWQFARLLRMPELSEHEFQIRWPFLLTAGILYLLAHTLWGTFWWQLLRSQNADVSWLFGIRAYFVSQFGKYVPGKAWVILLRMAMLRGNPVSPTMVAVTATYETLTSMAAGAVTGVILLPWTGFDFDFLSVGGFALLGMCLLPLALIALTVIARRIGSKHAHSLTIPPVWLLARGLVQALVGWAFLGLSLWCVVAGLSAEVPAWVLQDYLKMVGAVALSYVIGFAVIVSPGGLGAREVVLQQILGGPVAAVIALVLRLVWTAFEVLAACLLYFSGKSLANRAPVSDDNTSTPA